MNKEGIKIIGIAGGTCTGKTTLANKIAEELKKKKKSVLVISLDNYYKDRSTLSIKERNEINYDEPKAFDFKLLEKHLKHLKKGYSVEIPLYNFKTHTRNGNIEGKLAEYIIIEGTLLLYYKKIRDLLDNSFFIDIEADIRIARRIERDIKERGRTLESVIKQYFETVKPMHDLYIQPFKKKSNIILKGKEKTIKLSALNIEIL